MTGRAPARPNDCSGLCSPQETAATGIPGTDQYSTSYRSMDCHRGQRHKPVSARREVPAGEDCCGSPQAGDTFPQYTKCDAGRICGFEYTIRGSCGFGYKRPPGFRFFRTIIACRSSGIQGLLCSMHYTHENYLHEQQPRDAFRFTRRVCNTPEVCHHEVSEFVGHCDQIGWTNIGYILRGWMRIDV